MSKTIVHLQTVIQTVFVEVDDEGNVVKKTPYNVEVPKLDENLFVEAVKTLVKLRSELASGVKSEG